MVRAQTKKGKQSALVTVLSALGLFFGFLALLAASIPLVGLAVFGESFRSLPIPLPAIRYLISAVTIAAYCLGVAAILLCMGAFITAHAKRVSTTLPVSALIVGLLAIGLPLLTRAWYASTLELLTISPEPRLHVERHDKIVERDLSARTPLMDVVESGEIETVKELLEAGADPKLRPGNAWSAFGLAVRDGRIDIVEMFLEHEPTAADKVYLGQMLRLAAIHDRKEIATLLLDNEAEIDARSEERGWTPLMFAAYDNNADMVRLLLDRGADVNARNIYGWSILTVTARVGHLEIVQELIDRGAELNIKNEDGMTALMWAANEGHIDVVNALLDAGANPDIRSKSRDTAMKYAAYQGHTDVVRQLARRGAQR
jgi:ankyrin repeat protein